MLVFARRAYRNQPVPQNGECPLRAEHYTLGAQQGDLAQPSISFMLHEMDLIYPINFTGHDEWIECGYALDKAKGDVITRDGEIIGSWRVVDYDPEADDEGGSYEFVLDGQDTALLSQKIPFLDYRMSRGLALSRNTRTIKEWHEAQPT